ncbi:MAG TPA: Flp family type IVb pilin [Bacillota bacterium]|nr:Flp family type IVb pilin [Bacillota bacterium]
MKKLIRFLKDENGQGMVEYGLIIGLIALVVIGALVLLGPKIRDLFEGINDKIDEATSLE